MSGDGSLKIQVLSTIELETAQARMKSIFLVQSRI